MVITSFRKDLIINFHSFVDLITNSSSETYVTVTEGGRTALKELFDSVLKLVKPDLQVDNILEIVLVKEYNRFDSETKKHQYVYLTEEEAKEKGEGFECYDDEGSNQKFSVRFKGSVNPELEAVIVKRLHNLSNIFDIETRYEG